MARREDVSRLQDEHAQQAVERALFTVVASTASVVGADYFSAIAQTLADTLHTSTAFVCEFPRDTLLVRTTAVWPPEGVDAPLEYAVSGSAAERTRTGAPAFYGSDVRRLFPDDALVQAVEAQSFLAVPLQGSGGRRNGFVGIADTKRMAAALPAEAILRLAAARAGAEIERVQIERTLLEQGELLRMLTERAQDIILRYRLVPTPAVEYVSPAFERMTGYSVDELYDDPRLLVRMAHPDERDDFEQMLAGNDDMRMRWRYITKSGELLWIEGRRVAIRNGVGEVIAYETVARDMTAERTAQLATEELATRQQFLLDAIPDTILHVSRQGYVLDLVAPKGLEPVFSSEEVVRRNLSELLPGEFSALALQRLETAFVKQATQVLRYRVQSVEEDRVFEARMVPAGADQLIVLIRDVTAAEWFTDEKERKITRDKLESRAELRAATKNPYRLTFREFTVLELVAGGASDKQIATELGISVFTVGKHVSNILGKMGSASRTEASVRALQEGLFGG
jgi:PAS domain S-box-containing protein